MERNPLLRVLGNRGCFFCGGGGHKVSFKNLFLIDLIFLEKF